ncbi:MAG: hypothetical protein ACK4IX_09780, partial [Candidatus Sericytochromatia bacterium]
MSGDIDENTSNTEDFSDDQLNDFYEESIEDNNVENITHLEEVVEESDELSIDELEDFDSFDTENLDEIKDLSDELETLNEDYEENINVEEDILSVEQEEVTDITNSDDLETEKETQPDLPKYDYEKLREEIIQPQKLEATAHYLLSLPILGVVVKERFLNNLKKETDDVKIRALRVSTQKELIAEWKEQKQPYIVTHFTSQENLCSVDKNCEQKLFKSVYYEISNPVTNKNVMMTAHIYHNITVHSMAYYNEQLLNLGNSPQGFYDSYMPCSDLLKTLEKSNVPQD